MKIFSIFSRSPDRVEKRRAAQISKYIWNSDVKEILLEINKELNDKFIAIELLDLFWYDSQ